MSSEDLNTVLVSNATKKNWLRLNSDMTTRLATRANKKYSQKRIIPLEYFSIKSNSIFVEELFKHIEENNWEIQNVLFSLANVLLSEKKIISKQHVQNVLAEYNFEKIAKIIKMPVPTNEADLLGLVYQISMSEGQKNIAGSYYTHKHITLSMTQKLDFSNNQTFCDPCCGSGAFLLSLSPVHPNQIWGCDIDSFAVMIAKINMLLKFSDYEFIPQIFCMNYLENNTVSKRNTEIKNKKFDYIMTNPPWGINPSKDNIVQDILSNERFSQFFVTAFYQLKNDGLIHFLFPESILNVKTHKDIREFFLRKTCLRKIVKYDDFFTGVVTKSISIECSNSPKQIDVEEIYNGQSQKIPLSVFSKTSNTVFLFLEQRDLEILEKIQLLKNYTLANSIWALGIVTGDNKSKLKEQAGKNLEEIYTGKEITPFALKPAKNYIHYDRTHFQQVAKEEYYRAKEKLVYKFISNKLVFAYDNSQKLFLNSANILIPNIPNMSIKTVMAFLNSELFQFVYMKMFGEIKILKGNLEELPFPIINYEQNKCIENLVDKIIQGKAENAEQLQDKIYEIFNLKDSEIEYIREVLFGNSN